VVKRALKGSDDDVTNEIIPTVFVVWMRLNEKEEILSNIGEWSSFELHWTGWSKLSSVSTKMVSFD